MEVDLRLCRACWTVAQLPSCWARLRPPAAAPRAAPRCRCWAPHGRHLPLPLARPPAAAGRHSCRRRLLPRLLPAVAALGVLPWPGWPPAAALTEGCDALVTRETGRYNCSRTLQSCNNTARSFAKSTPKAFGLACAGWADASSGRSDGAAGSLPGCLSRALLALVPMRYPGCDAEAGCAAAGAWAAALSFSHPAGLRAEADFAATGRAVDAAGLLPFTTGARGLLPFCLAASRLARHSASCCSIFELIVERGCKASPREERNQTSVLNILNPCRPVICFRKACRGERMTNRGR